MAKQNAKNVEKQGEDIVELILEDHKPLKKLIKVLKDTDEDIEERKAAFEEFAPLLTAHAKSEEQVLYTFMKDETDLREEGLEGDVEHAIADQLTTLSKSEDDDEDLWSARVKVLAELVEHHIKEEEGEMLPDFKKECAVQERKQLGQEYLQKKARFEVGEERPKQKASEARMRNLI